LFYGDNLEVLRERVADESVDLIYLDPPFNSNRAYNVIFTRHDVVDDANRAQIQAFDDTWRWSPETDWQFTSAMAGGLPNRVAEVMAAMRTLLGENDAMAYLVNMAPRLVELHRVLKPTGSLFIHCDPTMSHYLKVLLDGIFSADHFANEIVWKRTGAKAHMTTRLPNNHDLLLRYTKSDAATWNADAVFQPYDEADLDDKTAAKYSQRDPDGRRYQLTSLINPNTDRPNLTYEFLGVTRVWRWTKDRMERAYDAGEVVQTAPSRVPRLKRYLDEQRGKPLGDVWADIAPINARAAERLGYPTQKPIALLERILTLASREGDVMLDPFCGCGTAIDAAHRTKRQWIGIDITYIAVDLIEKRLRHTFGDAVTSDYEVLGIPRDSNGALALFDRSPFEFERWAVSLLHGTPNQKQVGDRGVDGVVRFPTDARGALGKALVSVKGGKNVGPHFVRDLLGSVQTQRAEMGVLTTMARPTRGMIDAAAHAGSYVWPVNGQTFPRVQIATVPDLLSGRQPLMPAAIMPYIPAERQRIVYHQLALDPYPSGGELVVEQPDDVLQSPDA
jgi:site-specific DNA-methyltransferase (adenine-specific)